MRLHRFCVTWSHIWTIFCPANKWRPRGRRHIHDGRVTMNQLKEAEKKASQLVQDARKGGFRCGADGGHMLLHNHQSFPPNVSVCARHVTARVDRMKEAKTEAEQIISAYRAEMEAAYRSKLATVRTPRFFVPQRCVVTFLSRRHLFHLTATANGREWLCWQRPAVVHKHRNRQHEVRLLSWSPMQFALHCYNPFPSVFSNSAGISMRSGAPWNRRSSILSSRCSPRHQRRVPQRKQSTISVQYMYVCKETKRF